MEISAISFVVAFASAHALSLSTISASYFAFASLAFLVFSIFYYISASTLDLVSASALSLFYPWILALNLILATASTATLCIALEFFLDLASNSVFSLALTASLAISDFSLAFESAHDLALYTVSASAFNLDFLVFSVFSHISASTLDLVSASALSLFYPWISALNLIL